MSSYTLEVTQHISDFFFGIGSQKNGERGERKTGWMFSGSVVLIVFVHMREDSFGFVFDAFSLFHDEKTRT